MFSYEYIHEYVASAAIQKDRQIGLAHLQKRKKKQRNLQTLTGYEKR